MSRNLEALELVLGPFRGEESGETALAGDFQVLSVTCLSGNPVYPSTSSAHHRFRCISKCLWGRGLLGGAQSRS